MIFEISITFVSFIACASLTYLTKKYWVKNSKSPFHKPEPIQQAISSELEDNPMVEVHI